MFLTIDMDGRLPIYRQIADGIKNLIAKGDLRTGATLPPVRQLAADLNVNLNTVATAYRELQEEGLLTVKPGSGAVVASRTVPERNKEVLRQPLRTALTQMILAGLPRTEIVSMVNDELRGIAEGSKGAVTKGSILCR